MEAAAWIGIGIGVVGVFVAVLAYRSRHGKTRLSYWVNTNTRLVPSQLAGEISLSHRDSVVADPSLAIVRIVSTGDLPIRAEDFETDLVVRFVGADAIESASCSATRPPDLDPELEAEADCVRIKPVLINPGDMIQLQVLLAGSSEKLEISGRVANLQVVALEHAPYPPGSGPEGELTPVDWFFWYVVPAVIAFVLGVGLALSSDISDLARFGIIAAAAFVAFVVNPRYVAYMVRRRALWRPPTADEEEQ